MRPWTALQSRAIQIYIVIVIVIFTFNVVSSFSIEISLQSVRERTVNFNSDAISLDQCAIYGFDTHNSGEFPEGETKVFFD